MCIRDRYIATSLDGFIADKDGNIDWLNKVPNPENSDMGYSKFMEQIDAMVMGRNTFETVCGFDLDWPYQIPVFVLSNSLTELKEEYHNKVFIVNGSLQEVLDQIHKQGYNNLYFDGGRTIQSFLKEDLIDEQILTRIPILLGEGIPLFSIIHKSLDFELVDSKVHLNQLVQSHYSRKRN